MLAPLVVQIISGAVLLVTILAQAYAYSKVKTMRTQRDAEKKGTTGPKPSKAALIAFYLSYLYFPLWILNIFLYPIIRPYLLPINLDWFSTVIQIAGFTFTLDGSTIIQIAGFCFTLVGCGILLIGYKALGRNWIDASENQGQIRLPAGHQLVQTGIYSRIRHPIYLGMLCALGGVTLLLLEGVMIPIFLILVIWLYSQAFREEKVLLEHFGKEYEQYVQRTGRFFPRRKKTA
jgi:protein-S-isoprenylcysteine O-methyltransferase Ste14